MGIKVIIDDKTRIDKISHVRGVTKITIFDGESDFKIPLSSRSEPLDTFKSALQKFNDICEFLPLSDKKVRELRINGLNFKNDGNSPIAFKPSVTAFQEGDDDDDPRKQPINFPTPWFYLESDQSELFEGIFAKYDNYIKDLIAEAKKYLAGEFKVVEEEEEEEEELPNPNQTELPGTEANEENAPVPAQDDMDEELEDPDLTLDDIGAKMPAETEDEPEPQEELSEELPGLPDTSDQETEDEPASKDDTKESPTENDSETPEESGITQCPECETEITVAELKANGEVCCDSCLIEKESEETYPPMGIAANS